MGLGAFAFAFAETLRWHCMVRHRCFPMSGALCLLPPPQLNKELPRSHSTSTPDLP